MANPRIPFQLSSDRPLLPPPGGKPLMVHVVVNVENWRFDQPMPRKLLPAPHGVEQLPDVPNFSWAEYGMRCGMPRLFEALSRRALPASCALNAGVIEAYPRLGEAILEAGWEVIGHGLHQKSLQAEASEEAVLDECLERLKRFTGAPVQGWLGPGLKESEATPDLLKARGVRYLCDWVVDDLPTWMQTAHGPLIAMPYSLEINDSVIYAVERHASPEIWRRLEDTLQVLEPELARQPRVLTMGLHPHLIGAPHRFAYLEKMLDRLASHPQAVFMTGRQIADWFEANAPSTGA
ncbi:polysaccharide deacetylase family protein [Phenylobacterium sp.]|uniref:polysaccharide deacetylase family protein n=1 Tax=Phenylobacterium sp. TaxID=1871053 RepID=UPI0039835194